MAGEEEGQGTRGGGHRLRSHHVLRAKCDSVAESRRQMITNSALCTMRLLCCMSSASIIGAQLLVCMHQPRSHSG